MTTVYIVFDVDVSGPSLARHGIIAIGAHAQCGDEKKQFKTMLTLDDGTEFEPATKKFFKEYAPNFLVAWRAKAVSVCIGMTAFIEFTGEVLRDLADGNAERIVFACENPSLDAAWLNFYLNHICWQPLHLFFDVYKPVLDIDSYRMGWLGHVPDTEFISVDHMCAAKLGKVAAISSTHDPLDDAEAIYKNFMYVIDSISSKQ